VHCIGGIVGALLTGALVSKDISGSEGSVMIQMWGVATTLIYGFIVSFIILKIIDVTIGLRVPEDQERPTRGRVARRQASGGARARGRLGTQG